MDQAAGPQSCPACMVSPVGFQWELRVHRLAWAHTRVPAGSGLVYQKEPQDRLPQMLEVEVLEGACWDQVPHCTDGKTEGLAGEGSPRVCGARPNDVGRCLEWISRGETLRLKAYGGRPPRDQWGLQTRLSLGACAGGLRDGRDGGLGRQG